MSITLNGSPYTVTYSSGVLDDYEEQPGAVLTTDPYGIDYITRRYCGRLDKYERELDKYKRRRDFPDPFHAGLFAIDWTMDLDSPFPQLVVKFAGIRGGVPPEPTEKGGIRAQTVQLKYSGASLVSTSESATFRYKAPYVTFKYALRERPKAAKYRDRIHWSADALELKQMSGDDSRSLNWLQGGSLGGAISKTPPGGKSNSYNGIIEIWTPQLDYDQVGQWWQITETNEVQLLPLAFGGKNRVVINK